MDWVSAFIASLAATVGFAMSGHELVAWVFGVIALGAFVAASRRAWGEHQRQKADEADRAAMDAAIEQALSHRVELSKLMGANFRALHGNAARPEPEGGAADGGA